MVGVPSAFAGPSEIVVVADDTAPVDYAAIDVIVQAEHGPDGLAWLVTWDEAVADAVDAALERLVAEAPRPAEIDVDLRRGRVLRAGRRARGGHGRGQPRRPRAPRAA